MTVANAAMSPMDAQSSVAEAAQNDSTHVMEQRLLDYVARYQADGLAQGRHLGNPAALAGEALKSLKGYFERANALQDNWARKAQGMSENEMGTRSATAGGLQLASLPGGPANERLGPAIARTESGDKIRGISDAELDRTVEALMQVMHYSVETNMITSATHNVSKSVMSLLHGQ
jgi:hypothetical protein